MEGVPCEDAKECRSRDCVGENAGVAFKLDGELLWGGRKVPLLFRNWGALEGAGWKRQVVVRVLKSGVDEDATA